MRRKTRNLLTFIGALLVVIAIMVLNYYWRMLEVRKEHLSMRHSVEQEMRIRGRNPVDWELFSSTRPNGEQMTFDGRLKELDGNRILMVGYPLPLTVYRSQAWDTSFSLFEKAYAHSHGPEVQTFKNQTHFLLMALPLDCYFREFPPFHSVVYAQVEEGDFVQFAMDTPVAVRGRLSLNEKADGGFYYTIVDAQIPNPEL